MWKIKLQLSSKSHPKTKQNPLMLYIEASDDKPLKSVWLQGYIDVSAYKNGFCKCMVSVVCIGNMSIV